MYGRNPFTSSDGAGPSGVQKPPNPTVSRIKGLSAQEHKEMKQTVSAREDNPTASYSSTRPRGATSPRRRIRTVSSANRLGVIPGRPNAKMVETVPEESDSESGQSLRPTISSYNIHQQINEMASLINKYSCKDQHEHPNFTGTKIESRNTNPKDSSMTDLAPKMHITADTKKTDKVVRFAIDLRGKGKGNVPTSWIKGEKKSNRFQGEGDNTLNPPDDAVLQRPSTPIPRSVFDDEQRVHSKLIRKNLDDGEGDQQVS